MSEKIKLTNKDYRIINILHQIEELNSLIELHSKEGGISLMKEQYQEIKNKLLNELKSEFEELQIPIIYSNYALGA